MDATVPCAGASETLQIINAILNTFQVVVLAYIGGKARAAMSFERRDDHGNESREK